MAQSVPVADHPSPAWTTAGVLRKWARLRPDHPALVWDGGESALSYDELHRRSSCVAQALAQAGVGQGDRVAFLDRNSPEQVELFYGAAKLNAVPCPVNFRLAPPEVAFVVQDAGAKVFAVGAEFVEPLRPALETLSGVRLLVMGGAEGTEGGLESFEAFRDAQPPTDPEVPCSSHDVAYQLYSSGTTGRPKGVQLTHANLAAGLGLYPGITALGAESVSMVAMPLYHIGGGGWALAGFEEGATNVLVRDPDPEVLIELIGRLRVTHAFLVPAVIAMMLGAAEARSADFSSLVCILYGASPISEKVLAQAVRTFGCQFVQAYGLTETTGTALYLPAADHDPDGPHRHRLRAAGVPIPVCEAKVVDPASGVELPEGQVGEIWVRGPTVMKGFWNLPEQTEATITPDGWLRTGDAGYRDQDGYFYVHDRIKDMIVSGGENIYPAEVENAIMSHPEVADVAVIGVPHDRWGETPKALVVRRPGSMLGEEELLDFCRARLARFKCPTSVEWRDSLPRNPSGKVLKKELREPYWQGVDRRVG
jgi:long-chain acyl-CoA synthetase